MGEVFVGYPEAPFFQEKEFVCKCGQCSKALVSKELMYKLIVARYESQIPFVILSGCRCPPHNEKCGGQKASDHLVVNPESSGEGLICTGVDILCTADRHRYIILKALLNAGIDRIGLNKDFIHAGLSQRNPPQVVWFY